MVCITDASASLVLCLSQHSLALHSQLLAYATCMQDTLKIYHLPYMPSKMKIGSLISATHNKKIYQEILKIEEELTNPCLQRVSAYIATLHMGGSGVVT